MQTRGAKNQSLLTRVLASNFLLIGALVVLLTTGFLWLQLRASEQQLHLRAEVLADFVAGESEYAMLVGSEAELDRIARNALSVEDVLLVVLADATHQGVVRFTRPGVRVEGAAVFYVERPVLAPRESAVMEWQPPKPSTARLGSVRIGFSMEKQRALFRHTIRYGASVVAASLVLILACQYFQLRRLLRPLHGLMEFTRRVGAGDLQRKAPVTRLDEVGQLAVAFNQMVEKLGSTTVSKNYFNDIIRSMGESLIVVNPDNAIRTVNQATLAMLGCDEQELVGRPVSSVLEDATGDTPAGERVYRCKDGRLIPVLFSASAMRHQDEAAEGLVLMAQDITARKRAEQELRLAKQEAERANRAKTEFLSRTSHELRTPLNAILGFGQLLEIADLSADDRESVDQILKAGRHLLRLINDVLDIAGIETGRRTLSPEPVAIAEAAREALDLIQPLAGVRDIQVFDAIGPADQRYVYADAQRLRQVLLNLLSNAVKFNRQHGTVALSCEERPGGLLRIQITDTGRGIASEDLGKLFMPFERLQAEHEGIEGTGLGLAHSRSLVRAMRGTIGVESAPGQGSTFWLELPIVEAPLTRLEQEETPVLLPSRRLRACTLLHIEDTLSNRQLVERILAARPEITMLTATDGRAGLACARQHQPDVILLDLHLPRMHGDAVLRELQADPATADIPVVVLSADATPGRADRVLAAGAQAFLTKPVDVRLLWQVLDEILMRESVSHAK